MTKSKAEKRDYEKSPITPKGYRAYWIYWGCKA